MSTSPTAALSFEDAEVPTITRETAPNPFAEVIASLAATMETGEDGSLTGKSTSAKRAVVPSDEAKTHKARLHDAGRDNDPKVTVRVVVEQDKPKKGQSTLTFWTTPAVSRPRKNKDAEATETE